MGRRLRADADWSAAALALASGLQQFSDDDARVRLLDRVCTDLGDALYPAFIRLLCAVEHFCEAHAGAVVAQALAHGLATGRLPSGAVRAWGGGGPPGGLPWRSLGPIEFVCVWYRQGGAYALASHTFADTLTRLLRLIDLSAPAAQLYRSKLHAEATAPLEGAYSRQTRALMLRLVDAWSGAGGAEAIVQALLTSDAAPAFGEPTWSPLP